MHRERAQRPRDTHLSHSVVNSSLTLLRLRNRTSRTGQDSQNMTVRTAVTGGTGRIGQVKGDRQNEACSTEQVGQTRTGRTGKAE